ncbi:MAG: FumA C-terminus/TtdB family hydratase beta subunit [archaeon]|nr:FumA C-terminus/TtdB family hydratase beta subunit [archaeon]
MIRDLFTPLSEEDVFSLKLGDVVYLSGSVVTGRDKMHIRAAEYIDKGESIPTKLSGAVLYHCGPIMKRDNCNTWHVIAAGPTTSSRMNRFESKIISFFNIRAIIGKGGMSKDVLRTMKEKGCVYLAATGGTAVSLAESLCKVVDVDWLDLGMAEAMWRFEVSRFGPFIVAIDASGGSLYEKVSASLRM